MLKQITSWKHPVASTVMNMEMDPTFYEKYVLSPKLKNKMQIRDLYIDGLHWLDFNAIKQTPTYNQLRRLNILYNFIKLINLINPGSTMVFNRKGVPLLYDVNHNIIPINMMCNHSQYYIKVIPEFPIITPPYANTEPPPNVLNDHYWYPEKRYASHIVEQLLNIFPYEKFIIVERGITRLMPGILKIVHEYI